MWRASAPAPGPAARREPFLGSDASPWCRAVTVAMCALRPSALAVRPSAVSASCVDLTCAIDGSFARAAVKPSRGNRA